MIATMNGTESVVLGKPSNESGGSGDYLPEEGEHTFVIDAYVASEQKTWEGVPIFERDGITPLMQVTIQFRVVSNDDDRGKTMRQYFDYVTAPPGPKKKNLAYRQVLDAIAATVPDPPSLVEDEFDAHEWRDLPFIGAVVHRVAQSGNTYAKLISARPVRKRTPKPAPVVTPVEDGEDDPFAEE